jgi:AcrR family transcriptional regulator
MARDGYHHGDLRTALLRTARAAVERDGTDAFSLRAAADATGVSPSAVYRHFADREALLRALAVEVTEAVADRMNRALDTVGWDATVLEQVHAVADTYVHSATDSPNGFRLVFGPYGLGHPAGIRARDGGPHRPATFFARLAGRACEDGATLQRRDPAVVAHALWLVVHGAATLAVDGPLGPAEATTTMHTTIDHLWCGLAAPESEGRA